jgi:hypothetical protein
VAPLATSTVAATARLEHEASAFTALGAARAGARAIAATLEDSAWTPVLATRSPDKLAAAGWTGGMVEADVSTEAGATAERGGHAGTGSQADARAHAAETAETARAHRGQVRHGGHLEGVLGGGEYTIGRDGALGGAAGTAATGDLEAVLDLLVNAFGLVAGLEGLLFTATGLLHDDSGGTADEQDVNDHGDDQRHARGDAPVEIFLLLDGGDVLGRGLAGGRGGIVKIGHGSKRVLRALLRRR